ncbi:VIT1/CCC1 transporter family protein [Candidatus Micrarchaeota archaeon]|nr:VIT1/CCC1 transporter family protein [Candidatus Micrarchaeota archaeon]
MRIKELFQGIAMGLMDGLITLLGIIVGVWIATDDAKVVIISGLIGGISNSFGTSIGFYTSENAERGQQIEFYKRNKGTRKDRQYIHSHSEIIGSTILSFIAGAFAIVLPLLPFFLLSEVVASMISSLVISAMLLFVLGYYIGKINETDRLRSGLKYLFLGAMSSIVAFVVGEVLRRFIEGRA